MHIAFVSPAGYGHVNPTLPLVTELVGRGHRVTYATGRSLVPTVEPTGAKPLGPTSARSPVRSLAQRLGVPGITLSPTFAGHENFSYTALLLPADFDLGDERLTRFSSDIHAARRTTSAISRRTGSRR